MDSFLAPRDSYHTGHGRLDTVPRQLPRGTYRVFFGRVAMDVFDKEPRVYCADAHRGRRYRKLCFR